MDHSDVANKQSVPSFTDVCSTLMGDVSGSHLVNYDLALQNLGVCSAFCGMSVKSELQLPFETASSCMGWASNAQK